MLIILAFVFQVKSSDLNRRVTCNQPSLTSLCRTTYNGIDASHTHCFLRKTYTAHGWYIERGGTNESECRNNARLSTINNPNCQMTTTPPWTVCYDCCQQLSCNADSVYCNENDHIPFAFMPFYMNTGPLPTQETAETELGITPIYVTTETDTADCRDLPGFDCRTMNSTNICAHPKVDTLCPLFCGRCSRSPNILIG